MDVLSEVLRVVRLSGAIHFCGDFTQPWAFSSSPPEMLAARLKVPEGSVTPFHVFIEGRCWVTSGKLPPIHIETGDVIIFPRGDQHVMASDPGIAPVPIADIYSQPSTEQITVLKYGGGGQHARFICGFLHSDQQFDPLLNLCRHCFAFARAVGPLRSRRWTMRDDVSTHRTPREAEWWHASLRYLIGETAAPGPGNRAVLARLAEALFVEVLRWQFRHAAQGYGGWLAGLHDPQVGRVSACFMRCRIDHGPSMSWQKRRRCRARPGQTLCRVGRPIADPISRRLADAFGARPAAGEYAWDRRDRGTCRIRIRGGVQSGVPPAGRFTSCDVAAGQGLFERRERHLGPLNPKFAHIVPQGRLRTSGFDPKPDMPRFRLVRYLSNLFS